MSVPEFPLKHWGRVGPVAIALWPISLVFRVSVALRRWLYSAGLLRPARLGVPVVVVGNLTVGGTGKTPLVIALAHELSRLGFRPGVISRGYHGSDPGPRAVHATDSAAEVGDEALVLAVRSGCPVWIGRRRWEAGHALLADHHEVNVILCDDGLQHYSLARDIEIAVEDSRGAGNGFLLPAGPLREPLARQIEFRVANGAVREGTALMTILPVGFFMVCAPHVEVKPAALNGRIHAVAAIGSPSRFFRTLRELGLNVVEHGFPDHHSFVPDDVDFGDADWILMTEKDAVKCSGFKNPKLVFLRVDARLDASFLQRLTRRLNACAHGRQTP